MVSAMPPTRRSRRRQAWNRTETICGRLSNSAPRSGRAEPLGGDVRFRTLSWLKRTARDLEPLAVSCSFLSSALKALTNASSPLRNTKAPADSVSCVDHREKPLVTSTRRSVLAHTSLSEMLVSAPASARPVATAAAASSACRTPVPGRPARALLRIALFHRAAEHGQLESLALDVVEGEQLFGLPLAPGSGGCGVVRVGEGGRAHRLVDEHAGVTMSN